MIHWLRKTLSAYLVDYPRLLAYMLQQTEYDIKKFLMWWKRVGSFRGVAQRGTFRATRNSLIIRLLLSITTLAYWTVNVLTIYSLRDKVLFAVAVLVVGILLFPFTVVIITIPVIVALSIAKYPLDRVRLGKAKAKLANHTGIVIAIAGSYGKTSMKELLQHLIEDSMSYAVTAGNENTLMSQVRFIESLNGGEEVIIVELGEGAPGDIRRMVDLLSPDYAVLTGVAPNHLDKYGTLKELIKDFRVLADFVGKERTYINADNPELLATMSSKGTPYSEKGFDGWRVAKVHIDIQYVSFELSHGNESIPIRASLVGRHSIGPLAFAVLIALELGASKATIERRITALRPYEHRMQPRDLGGMWMIDDTYNGNIEGMRAGLRYLKEIKIVGKKLYATPGLVDQGELTVSVHKELGEEIADSNPDEVYLMKNSATPIIQESLLSAGYKGKINLIENPLSFYTNIRDVLARGDVMLCQNDLPDNYN
jgi:UDP-N-acetylmuramoyl-tripeptide--D-alanyl-D-alanine ligase